jgi:integrase
VVREYLALRDWKSKGEFARSLDKHVLPTLGGRVYESITRQDLARLRDDIATRSGRHASAFALQCLNVVWTNYYRDHASDSYTWPQVGSPLRPEDRTGPGRMLSDAELRAVWHATFKLAPNKGAWVRYLILTGCRRSSAARITRAQIASDWSQVAILGSVSKPAYDLVLSGPARDLLRAHLPEGARWAFEHLCGYAELKAELDIHAGLNAKWRFHDLRHTVRSLLSRVATPDIAELCIGHALRGMRARYDHHLYVPEKQKAMEALAGLIVEIIGEGTATA